ncbi:hypothetical protein [Nostoc sp.]|uniref:hypothetical protein n=1 Tax=Nostoc sp. TaxID=1180 RepID=UPI002FFACC5B
MIANYLNLIRHSNQDIVPGLINPSATSLREAAPTTTLITSSLRVNLKYPDASIELPANFPDVAKTPRFLYGDRLRWISLESDSDWGWGFPK